jgi:hypothetical protein
VAGCRWLNRVCILEFFGDKIAFWADHVAAQAAASHFVDALGDARLPIHEHVEIVGIEHEKARSGDHGHGRGSARAAQCCDLAEEMTGTEPNALALAISTSPAAMKYMRGLAASGDNVPGLDLLRVQQPHDAGFPR